MERNFRFSLALVTIVSAVPFMAAAATQSYDRTVNVADLDLASPRGEAALNRRIALAALAVCNMADGHADNFDCRADAAREAQRSAKRMVAEAKHASAFASARTDWHS